jgi:hypothetical protein
MGCLTTFKCGDTGNYTSRKSNFFPKIILAFHPTVPIIFSVIPVGETRLYLDQRLVALVSIERFGFREPGFESSQQREKRARSKRVYLARAACRLTAACLGIEFLAILSSAIKLMVYHLTLQYL